MSVNCTDTANDDIARLDWLEKHNATVYRSEFGRHWVVVDERATTRQGCTGGDLREAIDKART